MLYAEAIRKGIPLVDHTTTDFAQYAYPEGRLCACTNWTAALGAEVFTDQELAAAVLDMESAFMGERRFNRIVELEQRWNLAMPILFPHLFSHQGLELDFWAYSSALDQADATILLEARLERDKGYTREQIADWIEQYERALTS